MKENQKSTTLTYFFSCLFALGLMLPHQVLAEGTGTITGTVTQQGTALPSARLIFLVSGSTLASVLTDAVGNYTFVVPADVEIDIRVITPEGFIIGREFETVSQSQTLTLNFDFIPGTVVTGTVTQDGVALSGARVVGVSFNFGTTFFTDAQGQYSITYQSGRNVDVRFVSPDGTSCIGRVEELAPTPQVLTADFDFRPATVTGTVISNGSPVPQAGVVQIPFGFGCFTNADAQGIYTHLVPSGAENLVLRCFGPEGRLGQVFIGSLLPGQTVFADCPGELLTILAGIDIKPGSFPNSINLGSGGVVPVAILTTPTFDATTVEPSTVTLAGAPISLKGKGKPQASLEDVDLDGDLDLIVHLETEALQLTTTDETAILEGRTVDGNFIIGADLIRVVP